MASKTEILKFRVSADDKHELQTQANRLTNHNLSRLMDVIIANALPWLAQQETPEKDSSIPGASR